MIQAASIFLWPIVFLLREISNYSFFVIQDTVEERMQQVQARKQRMIAGALTDEEVRTARIEELKMLFR